MNLHILPAVYFAHVLFSWLKMLELSLPPVKVPNSTQPQQAANWATGCDD